MVVRLRLAKNFYMCGHQHEGRGFELLCLVRMGYMRYGDILADCDSAFVEGTVDDTDWTASVDFVCVGLAEVDLKPSERR